MYGEDVIALTKSQVDRLVMAYEEKKGITIRMSKTQLAYNAKIAGGFLPALARLIQFLTGTVLPALGVGTLSGLASSGKWCVSDRNRWKMAVSRTGKR